jgi:hypothetical protein
MREGRETASIVASARMRRVFTGALLRPGASIFRYGDMPPPYDHLHRMQRIHVPVDWIH